MKPTTIDHHELLERKANMARRRLMHTVDELEARKHTIEHEAASLLPIAAGAIGGFWLMASLGRHFQHWNARRRRRAQWRRFLRAVHLA
jgi:hypothetical protein